MTSAVTLQYKYTNYFKMKPEEAEQLILSKAKAFRNYYENVFPKRAGDMTLRFIDGNFRAQGWQGESFAPWKKLKKATNKTILVNRGRLKAGSYYIMTEGGAFIKNNIPYARVHNEGFNGIVNIPLHERRKFKKTKVTTGKFTTKGTEKMKTVHSLDKKWDVKAHTRQMNIPKRQFFPTSQQDSPVLAAAIEKEITSSINQIL